MCSLCSRGMVEVTTVVEYVVQRLRSALYEEWTEGKPLLRKCIRRGSVSFVDLRELLTDLISLWPTIRSFGRSTVALNAKEKANSVIGFMLKLYFPHIFPIFIVFGIALDA